MTDLLQPDGVSAAGILEVSIWIGLAMLSAALALAAIRLILGPTIPDRIVALELVASLFVGVVALASILADASAYLDVAIALTLVAFLGAIVFSRFVERRVGR
jgi:multicomponent Na+:H+ antiporter subunit F